MEHSLFFFVLIASCFYYGCLHEVTAESVFRGCFLDEIKVTRRALPYVQEIDPAMTVLKCIGICDGLGFPWSGVEYGTECYCGRTRPNLGDLPQTRCDVLCGGDKTVLCGGALAISAYEHVGELKHPSDPRPLVALVMILKDEAHTVVDTLKTVKPYVDRWFVLDTGSTDGTQQKVKEFMEGVPGKLFEEPFVDYGATRNRILELAKQTEECVFTLMLSADEQVRNGADMRKFLEDMRFSKGRQHNAYPVLMNSGIDFDSVRIARMTGMWRYQGRVHEYLTSPEKQWVDLYRPVPEVRVQFKATDETRRFNSQYRIMKILLEDLVINPNDTRAMFYLSRTYSTVGNHSEAYRYYEMLTKKSKWDEEIYHGKVMMAEESKHLGRSWQDRQAILLDAFSYKPDSMDALHALAQEHFNGGRYELAYLFALRAAFIKKPSNINAAANVLLRDTNHLYDYEGHRLLGFSAERVSEWAVCVDSLRRVLAVRATDSIAEQAVRNCESKLGIKPGEPVTNPIARLHDAQVQRMQAQEASNQAAKLHEDMLHPVAAQQPAPFNPIFPLPSQPIHTRSEALLTLVNDPVVMVLLVAVGVLLYMLRRANSKLGEKSL